MLDFGCGTGDFSKKEKGWFRKIVLYDSSKKALEIAERETGIHRGISELDVLLKCEERYDVIISITVLQHILDDDELDKVIGYMANHLKPDGSIIVMEQFYKKETDYIRSWEYKDLDNKMTMAGLKVVERYDFYENGIFNDERVRKYLKMPKVFLYYQLYARVPMLRERLKPFIYRAAAKQSWKPMEFLYDFKFGEGYKFLVYQLCQ